VEEAEDAKEIPEPKAALSLENEGSASVSRKRMVLGHPLLP
jgi:hypothetical protein